MTRVIERADQLVLEYVSKVADVAHGVLRTDQRLDFVRRLRDRIEEQRRGSDDPAAVRKVLGRFGDPAVLLRREVDRLTASGQPLAASAGRSFHVAGLASARSSRGLAVTAHSSDGGPPGGAPPAHGAKAVTTHAGDPEVSAGDFDDSATEVLPAVDDATPPEGAPTAVRVPAPGPAVVPSGSGAGAPEARGSTEAMEPDTAGETNRTGGPDAAGGSPGASGPSGTAASGTGASGTGASGIGASRIGASGIGAGGTNTAGGTDVVSEAGGDGVGGLDGDEGRMRAGRPPLKGTWGSPSPGRRRAGRPASAEVSSLGMGRGAASGGGRRPLPSAKPRMARGAAPGPVASGPLGERLRRATGAADGRDVATVLRHERREVAGMALLVLAGLLIPFPLPYLAIFPAPVLCWALGALVVLASHGWEFADRLTGVAAPIVAYVVGGVVFGAFRSPEEQGTALEAFTTSFFHVSGLMFMFGAVGGVAWLAYRLLNPPPPPPRRSPPGTAR